jgi:hypothetical protein
MSSRFRRSINPDAASHAPDEITADVEAEAGSPDSVAHLRVDAVELLDDPLLVGLGDADSSSRTATRRWAARGSKRCPSPGAAFDKAFGALTDAADQSTGRKSSLCDDI